MQSVSTCGHTDTIPAAQALEQITERYCTRGYYPFTARQMDEHMRVRRCILETRCAIACGSSRIANRTIDLAASIMAAIGGY